MGLFGGQPRAESKAETAPEELEREEQETSASAFGGGTVIAKGMVVSGAMRGEGAVRIEGAVSGEIGLRGSVVIAPGGQMKGPIVADLIRVAGRAEGTIGARDHLRLESTGDIEGDVAAGSLVVENGGCLNGRVRVVRQEDLPPEPPQAEEAPLDAPEDGEELEEV